jgi:apolipoprotein N-acyltransferase
VRVDLGGPEINRLFGQGGAQELDTSRRKADRRAAQLAAIASCIWLLAGGVLMVFGFGKWTVPLTPWLALVCLLHFTRRARSVTALLWVWLALFAAVSVANFGVLQLPDAAFLGIMAGITATLALAFVADRLLAPQIPGFPSTLVFPATWVALEFVSSRLNPYGTWGATAYTQYGDLPLMQLVSVTGIGGIAFLVAWFAAVVNWAWDRQFQWGAIRRGVLLYAAVWGVVMLGGGARLAFSRGSPTVRIAGISQPREVIAPSAADRLLALDLSATEREQVRDWFARVQDAYFAHSLREAQAGARIIVWPENNLLVFKQDEEAFLERARGFAQEHAVFLLMGIATFDLGAPHPMHNHAVLVDPAGSIAYSYTKITAVPGWEASTIIRGKGPIPVADTSYGHIASAICYDLDFPQLIRQVGRSQADILLVPASDYEGIGPLHQRMAEFRAVENGVAMFRMARMGRPSAVDPYGRPLAAMDDLASQDSVMVAQVPTHRVFTLYSVIGDLFAWLCVAGLLAGIGTGIYRQLKAR